MVSHDGGFAIRTIAITRACDRGIPPVVLRTSPSTLSAEFPIQADIQRGGVVSQRSDADSFDARFGNVTVETVRAIAETGVDIISSGWITHSAPSLDLGLDFQ